MTKQKWEACDQCKSQNIYLQADVENVEQTSILPEALDRICVRQIYASKRKMLKAGLFD